MEKNIEDNKLIAEFMGFEKTKGGGLYIMPDGYDWSRFPDTENYILPTQFLFHSDWNWLMEVIEKVEDLDTNPDLLPTWSIKPFSVKIEAYATQIEVDRGKTETIFSYFQNDDKFTNTYKALLEFIKWYNLEIKLEL